MTSEHGKLLNCYCGIFFQQHISLLCSKERGFQHEFNLVVDQETWACDRKQVQPRILIYEATKFIIHIVGTLVSPDLEESAK